MTTVDSTLASSLALNGGATAKAKGASDLGQQDFLTLMTAQLKNQDPFAPMENGEFLAQMAQFSTVAGIDRVNETLGSIGGGLGDFRMASAATLLDQSVLVPGTLARPDESGEIHGTADLTAEAEAVVVTYSHGITGELLYSQTHGPQPEGQMSFSWDGLPADLAASRIPVRIAVTATTEAGSTPAATSVFARVLSVNSSSDGTDVTLQVEDYGQLNSLEVSSLR